VGTTKTRAKALQISEDSTYFGAGRQLAFAAGSGARSGHTFGAGTRHCANPSAGNSAKVRSVNSAALRSILVAARAIATEGSNTPSVSAS
jgi:hypothetical protein